MVDSVAQRPIPRVRVRLVSDPRTYDGFTDANGSIVFHDVVPGAYGVRASADGYRFGNAGDVSAAGGAVQSFTVIGERTKLTRIGAVESRASPRPSAARAVGESDPAASVAGSVGGALPSITALEPGPDGSLRIHNHDPSTTAVTLNGAPIFPNATKDQLGLLGSDIFSSASLGSGAVAGAPNGTLDVRTYDPTIDWTGLAQERAASFGGTAATVQERGTAGRVGVSFTHAEAELGQPLDGDYFADTSGMAYAHHTNGLSRGDSFTARYGFDPNHVALVDFGSLGTTVPLTCPVLAGPLPCGYGPGNVTQRDVAYADVRDTLTLDRATLDLQAFASRTDTAQQFGDERLGGAVVGFANDAVTARRGIVAKASILYAGSRTANLTFSTYRDVTQIGGAFSSSLPPPVAASVSSLSVDVPFVKSRALTLSGGVGHDVSAGVGRATLDVRGDYQLSNRDDVSASFGSGHLGALQPAFAAVGDPSQLFADCNAGALLGDGPLFGGAPAGTTQTRAGFRHTGARVALNLEAYREVSRGEAVSVIAPASLLPASPLSPAYLAGAARTAAAMCGAPFPVSAANLFYRVAAPVDRTVNDGFDASAQFTIGAKAKLELSYSLSRARAFGSGFPFSPATGLVAGSQIPLLPLHREGAKLTYALSRSVSLLGIANFTGAGNAYGTRPFTEVDAGLRFATFAGDLVFGVQNVTNANGAPFAQFAPFPYLQTPIAPRTYSVRYRFAVGRQGIDRATMLSPPFGVGGFAFAPEKFAPLSAGSDGLAPAKDAFLCGPELLPQAKRYQDAIRAYDRGVRDALAANPRMTSFPPQTFEAVEMSYVPSPGGYAIRLHLAPGQARKINAFTRCTPVHMGTYDEALALHLYTPTWQDREEHGFSLYYSPVAGVYFAPEGTNMTAAAKDESLRVGAPAHALPDPFVVNETTCPATYRASVENALRSLKWYVTAVYADQRATAPDGFRIQKHAAKTEPWLEIRADDFEFGTALVTCLDAPFVTDKALAARGLGGAPIPSLNYAPSIGFYRMTVVMTKKMP
ncbi:MAG TPA: TonB-dependent receptor [Candidatus Elarobacter sp.]|nr:TonB-dependent receptor [Candidatus Elarobacter sp.]